MALITVTGYPCSGKSRRAQQLKEYLESKLVNTEYDGPTLNVLVLSDDSLNISRGVYDDSRLEKPARGTLLSAMQRHMGQDTILIMDSLNYIKGFRYQMYCAAREMKIRVCTIYVVAKPELCREWNSGREERSIKYSAETLDNLLQRYEEPSSMVRWDSPLFTVPWTDESPPNDDIWKAVTEGLVKPPNVGTQSVPKAPSDTLHILEHTTTAIVSAIMAHQSASQGLSLGGSTALNVSPGLNVSINLPVRSLTLSEVQRYKRSFVTVHKKAMTIGTVEKGAVDLTEDAVARKFVEYLEENLKP